MILSILLNGCKSGRPIRIGLTAELSGRNATLGVQSRNGAEMAVEEINALGGVARRPLELVVRDNQGSPEQVIKLDQELINSGIFVLTGHNTSWESVAARPIIDTRKAVLFSPTTSSPLFDNRDDYFFRLIPSNREQAMPLASYAYQVLNARRIAVLDDEDNAFFTHPYADAFVERFLELGGQNAARDHFSSKSQPRFRSIIENLRSSGADSLLVVASDADTALIAQQTRLIGWNVQILTSNWAYTSGLIKNGGRGVDGIIISSHFNSACSDDVYQQFSEKYKATYGDEPAFVSAFAYETVQVIAQALAATGGKQEGFAEALTRVRDFEGLCGKISMDRNGDAHRSLFLIQIRESQYQLIQTQPPEDAR